MAETTHATNTSSSSGASGSTPPTAPTRSSTRPPRRSSGRPPTPAPTTPSPPPRRPRRRSRAGRPGPPDERSALMREAAAAIRAKSSDLLPLVIAETGATATVGSRMQVPGRRRPLRALRPRSPRRPPDAAAAPAGAGHAAGPGRDHRRHGRTASRIGVVACITSYNFPMVNMAGKVAPALAAGNTVVVKPAPQDPLAIVELVRILNDVGFPPGVVNLVNGNTSGFLRRAGRRRRRRLRQLHRLDPGRRDHRREGGPDDEAHAARARRQGCLRRLRGRRRQGRPSGASVRPGRSTRVRSARHRRGPWCTAASSTRCATAWSRWRASSRWATRPTTRPSSGR